MLVSPLQVGDAMIGHLVETFVYVIEHVIPSTHKYLSWDSNTSDLGPILPEHGAPTTYLRHKSSSALESAPHAVLA